MKTFILLALISVNSFAACVDLSGEYALCRSRNNDLIEGVDMRVRKIDVPHNTFYEFDYLPDGQSEREKTFFPANGVQVKTDEHTTISARCLGNLLQVRRTVVKENSATITETSQYYKQGDDLVRISRGVIGEYRYTDILTCR